MSGGPSFAIAVRDSLDDDIATIEAIYAHHVLMGFASFEEVPPSRNELSARRADVVALGLPHLVATLNGRVAGFCYASRYRPRSAYRFTVEDSVYLAPGFEGRGIGAALLGALIERCEAGPWRQMIAVIGDSDNAASIALHTRLGFTSAGLLKAVGLKRGRWVDSVLMQRALGDGNSTLP